MSQRNPGNYVLPSLFPIICSLARFERGPGQEQTLSPYCMKVWNEPISCTCRLHWEKSPEGESHSHYGWYIPIILFQHFSNFWLKCTSNSRVEKERVAAWTLNSDEKWFEQVLQWHQQKKPRVEGGGGWVGGVWVGGGLGELGKKTNYVFIKMANGTRQHVPGYECLCWASASWASFDSCSRRVGKRWAVMNAFHWNIFSIMASASVCAGESVLTVWLYPSRLDNPMWNDECERPSAGGSVIRLHGWKSGNDS